MRRDRNLIDDAVPPGVKTAFRYLSLTDGRCSAYCGEGGCSMNQICFGKYRPPLDSCYHLIATGYCWRDRSGHWGSQDGCCHRPQNRDFVGEDDVQAAEPKRTYNDSR